MTLLYVVCNLPIFFNYIYYYIWSFSASAEAAKSGQSYTTLYYGDVYWWYSWSVTYVLCVALNSALNPIVYMTRMRPFRDFVLRGKGHVSTRMNSMFTSGVFSDQQLQREYQESVVMPTLSVLTALSTQ